MRGALKVTVTAIWLLSAGSAFADIVIPDDVSVQGMSCVGFDCVNNETSTDTLKFKENNTRIGFSNTASSGDSWQMTANDSSSGGNSYMGFGTSPSPGSSVLNGEMRMGAGANGGVALGSEAALVAGTVSVGGTSTERRLTNLAEGINDTDAITLGQMQGFYPQFDSQALSSQETQTDELEEQLNGAAAAATALSALAPNSRAATRNSIGIGLGTYNDSIAIAVGYFFQVSANSMVNLALSGADDLDELVSSIGFTYQF